MSTATVTLNATDRCLRCSAQAYVATTLPGIIEDPLLWCAHHFRHHEPKLTTEGFVVVADERERLLTPVESSA